MIQTVTFEEAIESIAINRSIDENNARELMIKVALINEAVLYPGDPSKGNLIYTEIWKSGEYSVKFGKYGKEYDRPGNKKNPYDMVPKIFKNDEICKLNPSFKAIFLLSEKLKQENDDKSLLILACLFIRNAFLIDHVQNSEGYYRYKIPTIALNYLIQNVGSHENIPIEAFLMYVDAIGWQEDVKYVKSRGVSPNSDIGRKNNMLTYVHFIACLLGRISFADMLAKFNFGVSPLDKKKIAETFPELKTSY